MSSQPPSSIEIEYAERCDREHARVCGDTRPPGLWQRLAVWRDERMVRHALKVAGEPGLILDLACGSGRFWPVLAEHVNRVILASDNSQAMLDHARTHHPAALLKRIKTFQGSAFSIGLYGEVLANAPSRPSTRPRHSAVSASLTVISAPAASAGPNPYKSIVMG